jgi:sugar O-acyltransferase (sialic acid O-acetyltransferase NeuD family)
MAGREEGGDLSPQPGAGEPAGPSRWTAPRGPIYLLGTGPLAEELWAVAQDAGVPVAAFVENLDPAKPGGMLLGCPVIWVDDLPAGVECLCALSTTRREQYVAQVAARAIFPNLVHPSAVLLSGTTLGEGTVISAGVIVAAHSALGRHVFCNRGVRIGHHTRVGDFATLQPGVNVAGLITVGRAAYIGMGALVTERLTVGEGATVAAGAVVLQDVPPHTMVAGSPAVVKKEGIDAR